MTKSNIKSSTFGTAVFVGLLLAMLFGMIMPTYKVNADKSGTGIPQDVQTALKGACNTADQTWYDMWLPSSITTENQTIALGGAGYVCGGAPYSSADNAKLYNIVVKDITSGNTLTTSGTTITLGNIKKGWFSSPDFINITSDIPSQTCHSIKVNYDAQATYGGTVSTGSGYTSPTLQVCNVNHDPTGNFTSVTCTLDSGVYNYNFTATWGDMDAPANNDPNAYITGKGNGNKQDIKYHPGATWTVPKSTFTAGTWPIKLWVQDMLPGGGNAGFLQVNTTSATPPACPNADSPPTGSITATCSGGHGVITSSFSDPDGATTAVIYFTGTFAPTQAPLTPNSGTINQGETGNSYYPTWTTASSSTAAPWSVKLVVKDKGGSADQTYPASSGSCTDLSCPGFSVPSMQVGVDTHFTPVVSVAGYGTPPGGKFPTVTVTQGSTTVYSGSSASYTGSGTLYGSDQMFRPMVAANNYTFTWTFDGNGYTNPGTKTCTYGGGIASYTPYFSVLGADIAAGPGFNGTCTATGAGNIKANNLGGSPSFFGAGSQLGAIAAGGVTGFTTSTNPDSGATSSSNVSQPFGLSFANSGASIQKPFNRSVWCIPDYAGDAAQSSYDGTTVASIDTTTPGTRTYKLTNPGSLGALTLQPGVKITVIVTGNVTLTGDIKYNYSALADVPQFKLLVKAGNINIASGVHELHGFYDAQPTSASSTDGSIYTCTNNSGVRLNNLANYTTCQSGNNTLSIEGATAARRVYMDRTYGSLIAQGSTPAAAAETFQYGPEMWLPAALPPTTTNNLGNTFDSITSLPPVL